MSESWVCPFCPLHCEDVSFGDDLSPRVPCDRLDFSIKSLSKPRHRIANDFVPWSTMVQWAKQQSFGDPIAVRVSTATLSQSKTLLCWHQENRIELTIDRSADESAMIDVMSRDAIITATLGDVRTHADFVWVLGDRSKDSDQGVFARLNRWISESAKVIHGQAIEPELFQKVTTAVLRHRPSENAVADAMLAASYVAILVCPGALSRDDRASTAAAELINGLVTRLNSQTISGRNRRAVIVNLNSNSTIDTVSLWQSNRKPTNSSNASVRWGSPVSDLSPVRLQIGGVDPGPKLADGFVATQIAGVEYSDITVRGDSSVTLPLVPLAERKLAQFSDARIGLDLPQDAFERLFHG
jgi:hypothetical protein